MAKKLSVVKRVQAKTRGGVARWVSKKNIKGPKSAEAISGRRNLLASMIKRSKNFKPPFTGAT